MIIIDLEKLKKFNLNINEYLTILKIYDTELPFNTHMEILNSVHNKGYIEIKGDDITLTGRAKRHFKLNSLEENVTEVLEYFKEITSKSRIDITSPTNRRFVRDRLQKYDIDDLKGVIDLKFKEWNNSTSMRKFIRIETLFNETKFQKYVNQLDIEEVEHSSTDNFKRI